MTDRPDLDEVGGWSEWSITEDAELGLRDAEVLVGNGTTVVEEAFEIVTESIRVLLVP